MSDPDMGWIDEKMWWIDEDKLAGSPNPSLEEIERLRRAGFATIVCLLHPDDSPPQQPAYDPADAGRLGYAWHNIPVFDYHAPTLDQFDEFRRLVEARLESGKLLVHCWGGSGRTGTMGAAYWVFKGVSAADAVARVRRANPKAIEAPVQRASLDGLAARLGAGGG